MRTVEDILGVESLLKQRAELTARNEQLNKQLYKYRWQKGHPEHENEVLLCLRWSDGKIFYKTSSWSLSDERWNNYYITFSSDIEVIAWSEIRPYKEQ